MFLAHVQWSIVTKECEGGKNEIRSISHLHKGLKL